MSYENISGRLSLSNFPHIRLCYALGVGSWGSQRNKGCYTVWMFSAPLLLGTRGRGYIEVERVPERGGGDERAGTNQANERIVISWSRRWWPRTCGPCRPRVRCCCPCRRRTARTAGTGAPPRRLAGTRTGRTRRTGPGYRAHSWASTSGR